MSGVLTSADRRVMELAGYGARAGAEGRAAVIVVDVTYAFCGHFPLPIDEAVARWRNACGVSAWQAVDEIQRVLAAAREADAKVVYTTGLGEAGGPLRLARKNSRAASERDRTGKDNEIVAEIAPAEGDLVLGKAAPSAFFGTALLPFLVSHRVQTLYVVGGVTSGCVRATAVDGYSYGFNVQVVAEACFDRVPVSHEVALFEMDAKYADVVDVASACGLLAGSR